MDAWTDYPITVLGDKPHEIDPIRKVWVSSYDGDKYCVVMIDGHFFWIKIGYLYAKPGRQGEVPTINPDKLQKIGDALT